MGDGYGDEMVEVEGTDEIDAMGQVVQSDDEDNREDEENQMQPNDPQMR